MTSATHKNSAPSLIPPEATIAVVGLGYVGLPLAVEFGKKRSVIGFDVRDERVNDLLRGHDRTLEVTTNDLAAANQLTFTSKVEDLRQADVFIAAVPTPVDRHKRPDLSLLMQVSRTIGAAMRKGAIVIYESTVYPGCTNDVCVPILEESSGLTANRDFFFGYSPERINPGDKQHGLTTIVKVTSGSTPEVAAAIDSLYSSIISAGTHLAPSIEVAEAAKVIENTQRDLNIALMNELSIIFGKLGIDTHEVLAAARTKWNFLPFTPGLVGGHCIGVDPYYLTYRAQEVGYHPEVILAGRRINDQMGSRVADTVTRLMMRRGLPVVGSRILVMGLTFKENCPDLRNSKVVDIISELAELRAAIDVFDPWVDANEAEEHYGLRLTSEPQLSQYDAIVVAVPHEQFRTLGASRLRAWGKPGAVLFDVKGLFPKQETDGRL